MNDSFKNWLKSFVVIGVSLFLIPTIADLISKNSQERNGILSFFSNSAGVFQVVGLTFTILSGATFSVLKFKEKKSEELLKIADKTDPIWDLDSLKYHTRFIFYKVQSSLKSKNSEELENYATSEFISWFNEIIENQKECENNNIDITETRIICCQDYHNNDKDKFAGYIKGIIQNSESVDTSPQKTFSEIYHFIRVKNDWSLNQISSSNIWSILSLSNKIE